MSRTVGLSQSSMLDVEPLAFLQAAAAGGFGGVGLRILAPAHSPARWPVVGDAARLRALCRGVADLQLRVLEVEAFTLHPHTQVQEDLAAALDAAAELGAVQVLTTSTDPEATRFAHHFGLLCEAAAERGMLVGLEFMPFRAVRDLAQAVETVQASQQANARVIVDALHLQRSAGRVADVAAVSPGLLACPQLCDAGATAPTTSDGLAAEARGARMRPGHGVLPLVALLQALPTDLSFTVEVPGALAPTLAARERAAMLWQDVQALLARAAHDHSPPFPSKET
jgi:sugar phosphate isomerase/epimerase